MIDEMGIKVKAAKPTPFHRLMGRLADAGWLLRLYTPNVDGLDTDMPSLAKIEGGANRWPIAIPLHGRLDTLFCGSCRQSYPFKRSLFKNETATAQCTGCLKFPIRTRSGRLSVLTKPSLLRPRMLFYDDPLDLDGELISAAFKFDLQQKVDSVLVVGTSLSREVQGVRKIVQCLCNPDRNGRRHTIWINPQPPPRDLEKFFSIVILAESDYVAGIWDGSSGTAVVQNTCQAGPDPRPSTAVVCSQLVCNDGLLLAGQTAPATVSTTIRRRAEQCPICGQWRAYAVMARHKKDCVKGSCNGNNFCTISKWNYHLTICELDHPGQREGASTQLDICKDCKEAFNFTNFKNHVQRTHQGQTPDSERTWTTRTRNARLAKKRLRPERGN